jgi:hypothetical protein
MPPQCSKITSKGRNHQCGDRGDDRRTEKHNQQREKSFASKWRIKKRPWGGCQKGEAEYERKADARRSASKQLHAGANGSR